MSFLNFLVPMGMPLGITKYISFHEKDNPSAVVAILSKCLKLLLLSSVVLGIVILLLGDSISVWLLGDTSYKFYIILIALTLPISSLYFVFDAFLKGIKKVDLIVKLSIISYISGLLAVVILTLTYDLKGAIIGFIISSVFNSIIFSYAIHYNRLFSFKHIFSSFKNNIYVKQIFKIGIASLLVGALQQLNLLIIRRITIENFGLYSNGILQSVLSVSFSYFGIIFLSLSSYSFPKISELKLDSEIINELNINFRFVVLIIVPLISIIFIFRDYVVILLYSKDFSESEALYIYQFIGEFFKSISWVFGLWLIPKLKIFTWAILDIIFNINFLLFYVLLIKFNSLGFINVSIAYMGAYFIHALLNVIVTYKILKFSLERDNLRLFILSLLSLSAVISISQVDKLWGYLSMPLILFLWINLCVKESERNALKMYFTKFKNLFK